MDRLLIALRHPESYDFTQSRSGLIDAHDSIWLCLMQVSSALLLVIVGPWSNLCRAQLKVTHEP